MHQALQEEIAVSSGTAGLAIALRSLGRPGSWIAVPATICPNIVVAILAAGCRPHFIDIERHSLGIDPGCLREAIAGVSAVIAVHALGEPCRIDELANICREAGVPLVEDCAQAEGALDDKGRPVGLLGDVAVFSYGAGKILDLGGGGIVRGRTPKTFQSLKEASALEVRTPADGANAALSELSTTYKRIYNTAYPTAMGSVRDAFTKQLFEVASRPFEMPPMDLLDTIIAARKNVLGETLIRRRTKRDLYRELLGDVPEVKLLPTSPNGAPWRSNIWLGGSLRDPVLKSMLKDRMNVSSWHPDIRPFLSENVYRSSPLPNARWFGDGVLNLWLDDDTSEADIARTSKEIRARISRISRSSSRGDHVPEI